MEFNIENLSFIERVQYLNTYRENPNDEKAKLVFQFMKSVYCDKCKCSWAEDPQLHLFGEEEMMLCYFVH
jgi:hypothetical protein